MLKLTLTLICALEVFYIAMLTKVEMKFYSYKMMKCWVKWRNKD